MTSLLACLSSTKLWIFQILCVCALVETVLKSALVRNTGPHRTGPTPAGNYCSRSIVQSDAIFVTVYNSSACPRAQKILEPMWRFGVDGKNWVRTFYIFCVILRVYVTDMQTSLVFMCILGAGGPIGFTISILYLFGHATKSNGMINRRPTDA